MTDKDTVATVASEAVRAIRGMNALLKDYSGTALAHLYELQETETIRLIVGATAFDSSNARRFIEI